MFGCVVFVSGSRSAYTKEGPLAEQDAKQASVLWYPSLSLCCFERRRLVMVGYFVSGRCEVWYTSLLFREAVTWWCAWIDCRRHLGLLFASHQVGLNRLVAHRVGFFFFPRRVAQHDDGISVRCGSRSLYFVGTPLSFHQSGVFGIKSCNF